MLSYLTLWPFLLHFCAQCVSIKECCIQVGNKSHAYLSAAEWRSCFGQTCGRQSSWVKEKGCWFCSVNSFPQFHLKYKALLPHAICMLICYIDFLEVFVLFQGWLILWLFIACLYMFGLAMWLVNLEWRVLDRVWMSIVVYWIFKFVIFLLQFNVNWNLNHFKFYIWKDFFI